MIQFMKQNIIVSVYGGLKMEGTVKWYSGKKGYGIICGDDEINYFVHYTSLGWGIVPRDDDRVSFKPVETKKFYEAQRVILM